MKKMILTSSLTETKELVKDFLDKKTKSKKILFVPTAAMVEDYKDYIHLTKQVFLDMGYEVEDFDVAKISEEIAKQKLTNAEILFVSGGNTFYLLQELKRKNLIELIKEKVEKGMFYIGESAGSVITTKDIEYAAIMDDKTLAPELNIYESLNLVNFYIVPHFGEEPFKESAEKIVEIYKDKLNLKLINNKQVIIIEDNNFKIK